MKATSSPFGAIRWSVMQKLPRAIASVLFQNSVSLLSIILIVMWQGNAPALGTLPASAAAVYAAANTTGWTWLGLWLGWRLIGLMLDFSRDELGDSIGAVIRGLVERGIMLWLALTGLRKFGPLLAEVIRKAESDPTSTIAAIIGFAAVYGAFSALPKRRYASARGIVAAPKAVAGMAASTYHTSRKTRDAYDVKKTAVHEIGHALLYAALPSLPKTFYVKVLPAVSVLDPYRGFVAEDHDWTAAETESAMRLRMLIHLGGTVAEQVVYGERSDGAEGDNAKWTGAAQAYLTAGFGEPFFATPEGPAQIEHNRLVLNSLKSELYAGLVDFFTANRELVDEMTAKVLIQHQLNRDELTVFFHRVMFTESVSAIAPRY